MYKKPAGIALILSCLFSPVLAQTSYLQLGQEDYQLLDRLETRSGRLSNDLFLSVKPVSRKSAVKFLEEQRDSSTTSFSSIDEYNIRHMISVSGEWAADENGAIDSKKPWFKTFYKKQPDMVYVKTKDFFLSANPVISAQFTYDKDNPDNPLFMSTRGFEARGWIAKKLGFYTYVADNQEQTPSFVTDWINKHDAVPGADFYTSKSPGHYDYLQAKGYIDFAVVKNYINITLGYDKAFYGDGYRTLFLSDFAANAPYLRVNLKIWKLNYQLNYTELTPQLDNGTNQHVPHKYATMHNLSINLAKWLNIGVFETVVFNRVDRYEFSYLMPIIFYRSVERALGSPDNVMLGFNFKAIAAKRLQFYGQVMLDEFTISELSAGDGYWANKFGIQFGGKYFDAFGAKNLDLQGEINLVRPFTYTHFDTIANYTHYNQPLAHPLEASFAEVTGIARYQPVKNLYLSLKGMYYEHGADTGSSNYGVNIFKEYDNRSPAIGGDLQHGYKLISGIKTRCASLNLNVSYELRENLFFDLGGIYRRFAWENGMYPTTSSTCIYGGFRLNLARRDYSFY